MCAVSEGPAMNWFSLHILCGGENITLERFIEFTSECC